jgi:hypothetical protein
MAKRGLAWQQPPPSQPMRHKLLWRFLGSGDYLSVKTVRSIASDIPQTSWHFYE